MPAPRALVLLALLALAACQPEPGGPPRAMLGQPYSLGGLWSYPREDFTLDEKGVAAVLPDGRSGRRTANGELFDHGALQAAHRTLQLPAIVTVTNLENGREIQVRVNDRGPEAAGRVLGLSRRAAELLGIPRGGTAQVRVAVDGEKSRAAYSALPSTEARPMPIAAAPTAAVEAEALAPLPGARTGAGRSAPAGRQAAAAVATEPEAAAPPTRLPETVAQRPPAPGRLVVEAGSFFRADLARQQAARLAGLGARVETEGRGRQALYRVRMGPFATVAEADRAVAGVLAAGLPEVRLLVE